MYLISWHSIHIGSEATLLFYVYSCTSAIAFGTTIMSRAAIHMTKKCCLNIFYCLIYRAHNIIVYQVREIDIILHDVSLQTPNRYSIKQLGYSSFVTIPSMFMLC